MSELNLPRQPGPCPVCGTPVVRPVASCSACHTPHHEECWSYNGGCAIFGCTGHSARVPPVPRWSPERFLARAGVVALCLAILGALAATSRSRVVSVRNLWVSCHAPTAEVSFGTSARVRCTVELHRLGERVPSRVERTGPGRVHRVVFDALEPGATYLVRVRPDRQGRKAGLGATRLFSVARAAPPRQPAVPNAPPVMLNASAETPLPVLPRNPFQMPSVTRPAPAMPIQCSFMPYAPRPAVPVVVEPRRPVEAFGRFELQVGSNECEVRWMMDRPAVLCRAILSRDASLRGIEKVFDARPRAGSQRVLLTGLKPDVSYQVLILAFPENGDPVQSPVLAFRTQPR